MLYAKASNEETPITGILKDSAIAFTEDIPILIPVNEPGPTSQDIASMSDNFRLVVLNSSSIKGIKVSECVLLLFIFNSNMQSSFSEIETDAILLDVEMLRIFINSAP